MEDEKDDDNIKQDVQIEQDEVEICLKTAPDIINNQAAKIQELEFECKQSSEALEKEQMEEEKGNKMDNQAKILDIENEQKKQEIAETKILTKKLEKIEKENVKLKEKLNSIQEGLEKLSFTNVTDLPSTEEEIMQLTKALSASKLLLKQKDFDLQKSDQMNAELNIRLELEHERRLRAQTEIGEIEKERMVLQNDFEKKSGECVKKSHDFDEVRLSCDYKINKYTTEIKKLESKLDKLLLEKDKKIFDLQSRNTELYLKLESVEEHYTSQVEISKTLQNELQASYVETKSLIKEMEMLNLMFAELEQHIFSSEAGSSSDAGNVEVSQNGKQIKVDEVLKAAQSTDPSKSLFQKSCFNEVTTKNGTRMVLSVSKTFLKLKDLILEKNALEEQMTKMKHINLTLCSQVNLHEEKLCGITDELNNTWFYVSKIKEQHKKLHSSEQILRAELAEKRQLLKNIRKELEESRTSWNLVKQKNAESEKQWLQLKADLAERKRLLMSSSESGFSEVESEDKVDDLDSGSSASLTEHSNIESNVKNNDKDELVLTSYDNNTPYEDNPDSEEIPDPFSDDENDDEKFEEIFSLPMVTSAANLQHEDDEDETESVDKEKEKEQGFTPIFVPSMSFLAQVPATMQPELIPAEKELIELASDNFSRDRVDEDVLDDVDDDVRDLINRLSSSTARGAFLANRLADIHRRIATGTSLTDHNDWFDIENEDETETDIEPRDTEEEDDLTVPSPELESEIEKLNSGIQFDSLDLQTTSTPFSESVLDDSRPASTDSMVLAIDEAINILDPVSSGEINFAPPQPTYSIHSPSNGILSLPNFNHDSDDDENNEDIDNTNVVPVQSTESSTAVTRYLIKHLPKQLTQLRNEKHQLEDKIHDFEQIISEQRMQMAEHERRVEVERSKTKKMEERLAKVEAAAASSAEQNLEVPSIFTVPVEVEQEKMILNWTVESKSERPCGYWISFVTPGATDDDEVILPNMIQEVIPREIGLTTSLQAYCGYRGKYTLHIEGSGSRMPEVKVNLSPAETCDVKSKNGEDK